MRYGVRYRWRVKVRVQQVMLVQKRTQILELVVRLTVIQVVKKDPLELLRLRILRMLRIQRMLLRMLRLLLRMLRL